MNQVTQPEASRRQCDALTAELRQPCTLGIRFYNSTLRHLFAN